MKFKTQIGYENYFSNHNLLELVIDIIGFQPSTREASFNKGASISSRWEDETQEDKEVMSEYLSFYKSVPISDVIEYAPCKLVSFDEGCGDFDLICNHPNPFWDNFEIIAINTSEAAYQIREREEYDEDEDDDNTFYTNAGRLKSYCAKAEHTYAGQKMIDIIARETRPNLYIGVELECVAKKDNVADRIHSNYEDYVICKEDGSLPDSGLEIVTIPQTPEFHRVNMARLLEEFKDELRSFNHSSCGLHIHLSKRFFTTTQIGKMVLFINHDDNYEFMKEIAQRNFRSHSYCHKAQVKNFAECIEGKGSSRKVKDFGRGAVNIGPTHTIELRIFKGNTKVSSMLAKIDFVEALSYFVKKFRSKSMTVDKFIAYLKTEPTKYLYLKAYLKEKLKIDFDIESLEQEAA